MARLSQADHARRRCRQRATEHVKKRARSVRPLVVLGGPALLIGLGGGAASSMATGASSADLDFASVQRDNPEMERRCQEVIDLLRAWRRDADSLDSRRRGRRALERRPRARARRGARRRLELRAIPSAEPGMSPLELWCNEAQERYVLAIEPATSRRSAPSASANAVRSPCSASPRSTAAHAERLRVRRHPSISRSR